MVYSHGFVCPPLAFEAAMCRCPDRRRLLTRVCGPGYSPRNGTPLMSTANRTTKGWRVRSWCLKWRTAYPRWTMTTPADNQPWLDQTVERPLDPSLPICDPHHHLWDRRAGRVSQRYLLDEILEDTNSGHTIASTVFIECGAMYKADGPEALRPVGETEFVNGVAAMSASELCGPTRVAAGIVGTVDLRLGAGAPALPHAHIAAGPGRFRGPRPPAAGDADPARPRSPGRPGSGPFARRPLR